MKFEINNCFEATVDILRRAFKILLNYEWR